MHTFQKFNLSLIINNSITMDDIDEALKSLQLHNNPNVSAVAEQYYVDRSTLSRRFRGVTYSHVVKCQNQGLLSPAQEKSLVQYINKLTETGIPPTVLIVHNFVYNIVGKRPGKS